MGLFSSRSTFSCQIILRLAEILFYREQGYNQQALHCYRRGRFTVWIHPMLTCYYGTEHHLPKILDIFQPSVHHCALFKHLSSHLSQVWNAFLVILKQFPHDLTVLRKLHTILIKLSDFSACAALLQDALAHYTAIHLSGEARDNAFGLVIPSGGFSQMDLLLLTDLIMF